MSPDNDLLFQYHQWQADLRVLHVEEVKSIPSTPTTHRLIERLIGTVSLRKIDRLLAKTPIFSSKIINMQEILHTTIELGIMNCSMSVDTKFLAKTLKAEVQTRPHFMEFTLHRII